MDAFDADALIYAAVPGHPLGRRVLALFDHESASIEHLPRRLDHRPVDGATARLAVALGAAYRLKAGDAVHLATAVDSGADRFVTNQRRDFPPTITEINVTCPDELPAAAPHVGPVTRIRAGS